VGTLEFVITICEHLNQGVSIHQYPTRRFQFIQVVATEQAKPKEVHTSSS